MKQKLILFFRKNKKKVFSVLRVIISVSLIYFLIRTQFKDARGVVEMLRSADISFLLLAASTHIFGIFITVVRWKTLLLTQKMDLGFGFLVSSAFVGLFFNNLLPTSVGGDVYRAYDIAKKTGRPVEISLSVVLMGRLTGIISAMVFAVVALFLGFTAIGDQSIIIPVAILFFISLVTGFLILNPSILKLDKLVAKIRFLNKIKQKLANIYHTFKSFKKFKWALSRVFIYSLLLQFSVILFYFFVAKAFGIKLDFITFLFIVPIVTIIAMIPISIGGIGLRENSLVFIMVTLGAIREKAALSSLTIFMFLLVFGIIGGLVYIIKPFVSRRAQGKEVKKTI